MSAEPPIIALTGPVLGTRRLAREFIAEHADRVSPTGAVYLDCRGVRVMTSPWISEVQEAWPHATLVRAADDIAEDWEDVRERREQRATDDGSLR